MKAVDTPLVSSDSLFGHGEQSGKILAVCRAQVRDCKYTHFVRVQRSAPACSTSAKSIFGNILQVQTRIAYLIPWLPEARIATRICEREPAVPVQKRNYFLRGISDFSFHHFRGVILRVGLNFWKQAGMMHGMVGQFVTSLCQILPF